MTEIRLRIPEVRCDHCKTSLEAAVGALKGVADVEVTLADAVIEVSYNPDAVDLAEIKEAIEDRGYHVFD